MPVRMQCLAIFFKRKTHRETPAGRTARCDWFACSPKRANQLRMLFRGEADKEAARPAGCVLVRQVESGSRVRAAVFINAICHR